MVDFDKITKYYIFNCADCNISIDIKIHNLKFSDLIRQSYTFGRGENCDYQFNTQAMRKHPCFQAYSKVHFTLTKVCVF